MFRESKQTFLQRRHTDGQWANEKLFIITRREMQIKTTIRYYLTSIREALIPKRSLKTLTCRDI